MSYCKDRTLDQDVRQRVKGVGTFLLEFYKLSMGSFLTVFVPHQCPGSGTAQQNSNICSLSYNIRHGDTYHTAVLWINLLAFLFFLEVYRVEIKRENWCISHLDIDPTKSAENLDDEIEQYPLLKRQMHNLNKKYEKSARFCTKIQFVNIILSITDVGRSWAGSVSFVPLLSYILLIGMKLYTANRIANSSLWHERAYSAYLTVPKTYNTIDKDHSKVVLYDNIELTLRKRTPDKPGSDQENEITVPSCSSSSPETRMSKSYKEPTLALSAGVNHLRNVQAPNNQTDRPGAPVERRLAPATDAADEVKSTADLSPHSKE